MLNWGLVPAWAKDPAIANRMINARAETVIEKPAFRSAFQYRRCLIPADGYYEWATMGGRKQPYYVRPKEGGLFGFAGLYEHWRDPQRSVDSCTIITTDANEVTRSVHARMPVILPLAAYAHWLDYDNNDLDALAALLAPAPSDAMRIDPVSVRVNDVKNDDAALIETETLQQLF